MAADDIKIMGNKLRCVLCHREFDDTLAKCPFDGANLIAEIHDPLLGTRLAEHYKIISVIGHGGMGVVYKAKHDSMDRFVAIKMLQAQHVRDGNAIRRFRQEAKAASRLSHPNVITIHDFGMSPNGQPYIVMDYIEGIGLDAIIKKDGKVGVDRSVKIFAQACDALAHAHEQGIVHRDLKPSNIMLIETEEEKDFVKIVDFGVAKLIPFSGEESQRLTQTGEVCGSPIYMSPEQCMGHKLDARSDIYSMGIMIYEAITGELPLLGNTMVDTMNKHLTESAKPFSVVRPDLYIPERIEKVVFKALEKDPKNRQQSMTELKQELLFSIPTPAKSQQLRTMVPKQPVPSAATPDATKPSEATMPDQVPAKLFAAVIAVIIVVGLSYAWIYSNRHAADNSMQAPAQKAIPAQSIESTRGGESQPVQQKVPAATAPPPEAIKQDTSKPRLTRSPSAEASQSSLEKPIKKNHTKKQRISKAAHTAPSVEEKAPEQASSTQEKLEVPKADIWDTLRNSRSYPEGSE